MERFFMERLKYIVEDSTIAELLGVQNFTNKESAILELVKNAYDAQANNVSITFSDRSIVIIDDGIGMSKSTICENWMHVGKVTKDIAFLAQKIMTAVYWRVPKVSAVLP